MDEKTLLGFVLETQHNFRVTENVLFEHKAVINNQAKYMKRLSKSHSALALFCSVGLVLSVVAIGVLQDQITELQAQVNGGKEEKTGEK